MICNLSKQKRENDYEEKRPFSHEISALQRGRFWLVLVEDLATVGLLLLHYNLIPIYQLSKHYRAGSDLIKQP